MAILLLADHDGQTLSDQTARALSAAVQIDPQVDLLVAGHLTAPVAEQAAGLSGVRRVLVAADPALAAGLAEPLAALILRLAPGYEALVAPATSTGRNVLPRVAATLDVMQVSEVIAVVSPTTFSRPIYAGNAIETVEAPAVPRVLTIRGAAFAPAAPADSPAPIESIHAGDLPQSARFVENRLSRSDRPDLSAAKIVVSGGRALGSKAEFDRLLLPVADKLGAAVGASRAAVDAGYAQNDLQVGQTGKIVAPDLYLACGISGAIQHLAGMKDSRIIIAVNKDPDAPIFQVADYGLVGDVFEVLPVLEAAL